MKPFKIVTDYLLIFVSAVIYSELNLEIILCLDILTLFSRESHTPH